MSRMHSHAVNASEAVAVALWNEKVPDVTAEAEERKSAMAALICKKLSATRTFWLRRCATTLPYDSVTLFHIRYASTTASSATPKNQAAMMAGPEGQALHAMPTRP